MIITDSNISTVLNEYQAKYGKDRNKYYGLLYLEGMFDIKREECLKYIAFSDSNLGIDGYFYDRGTKNLYIYQFQNSPHYAKFEESLRSLINNGITELFSGQATSSVNRNRFYAQIASTIEEHAAQIQKIYIHFVFTGNSTDASESALFEKLFEDLENKRHIIETFFCRSIDLKIQFICSRDHIVSLNRVPRKIYSYDIKISEMLMHHGSHGERLFFTFINLGTLLEMYREMGIRFLDRNIRSALPSSKKVNHVLYDSFEKIFLGIESPASFLFYHNGTTLYVEKMEQTTDGFKLVEPRLLNGAQTISTFKKFVDDNKTKLPNIGKEKLLVPCKIISNAENNFVTTVTINNNRQNPVEPWNLRAHDEIQLKLQDKFRNDLGIFYERQENVWEAFQDNEEELADYLEKNRCIELVPLAKTLLASDGKINYVSSMRQAFESDDIYKDIFNDRRLGADSKSIVLCYKIQLRLTKLAKEIIDRGDKYHFMMRARNLLWALLCQAILNDPELETLKEAYGMDLIIKREYTDKLAQLSSTRCRPIISALIDLDENKNKVLDGKWSFLSQPKAYKHCMLFASEKWDWEEKRLKK